VIGLAAQVDFDEIMSTRPNTTLADSDER